MKDKSRKLAVIYLTNLVLNSPKLVEIQNAKHFENIGGKFEKLPPEFLYPRLMRDIDFEKLKYNEQGEFLFMSPEKLASYNPGDLYERQLIKLTEEAHSRICSTLGVPPAKIVFSDLSARGVDNKSEWVLYDPIKANIIFDISKDYRKMRPSYYLELINFQSKTHSIYRNIFEAIENPDCLSDREFYLAIMTATSVYVSEYLKKDLPDNYKALKLSKPFAPEVVDATIYAYSQTRRNFLNANIYGGKLRKALRQEEIEYYDLLQQTIIENCLSRCEDIVDNFVYSPLNEKSGGILGTILKGLEKELAHSFFNPLGVQMQSGTDATKMLDIIENEILKHKMGGLDDIPEDELEELAKAVFEDFGEMENEDDNAGLDNEFYGEEDDDQDFLSDDEFMAQGEAPLVDAYSPNLNVLPKEGKINNISILPFHKKEEDDLGREM